MSASGATGHGGSHEVENEMSQTRGIFFGAILAASSLGTQSRAAEPEFCVSCAGPPAQYRCTFSGDASVTPKGGLQLYCITTLAREGGHESCAVDRQTAGGPCAGTPKVLALPAGAEPGGVAQENPAPAQPAPAAGATAPLATSPSGSPAPAAAAPQPPQDGPSAETKTEVPASSNKWSDQSGAPQKPAGNPAGTAKSDPDENSQSAPATNAEPVEKAGKAVTDAAESTGKALEKAGSAVGQAAKKTWKCLSTLFGDC